MTGLHPDVELVLRGALSDDECAIRDALGLVSAPVDDLHMDPRAYAALPALCGRLRRLDDGGDRRWDVLRGVARRVWAQNQLCLAAAKSALDAMTSVDAPSIVLPGALTAMAALGDSGARVFERIDVLVAPDHVPRITAALLATGATIRQSHGPLLGGRVSSLPPLDAELTHGVLVARWHHPAMGADEVARLRTRAQLLRLDGLRSVAPAPPDALVAVLASLSDTAPGPTGWTNLVLELARVARVVAEDPAALHAAACSGHAAGRHPAWAALLNLVGDLSGDPKLADAAGRFGATTGPPRLRSAPQRAAGLARYLNRRWQRVVRARWPHPISSDSSESSIPIE